MGNRLKNWLAELLKRLLLALGRDDLFATRVDLDLVESRLQDRISTLESLLTSFPLPAHEAHNEAALPVVSVITPTRNRGRDLQEAVHSIKAQYFSNWELLIVDDGSTDDTAEITRQLTQDRRIKYIRVEASDTAIARNAGLAMARGE